MSAPCVIVGGGLAGLAAAIGAADAGIEVELYERGPRLGGATWSFRRDGISFDNGQHVFMRCCTEYREFLARIGSAGKVTLQSRMDVPVVRPGGPTARLRRSRLPAPLHLGAALARYRHLSPRDRLGVVRTALALGRLDPADRTLDETTFAGWLAAHGGTAAATEALWDVVCLPTVNLPASEASMMLAAKVFRTGLLDSASGGDIGWASVPLQELHGDAAGRVLRELGVRVHTGSHVEAIEPTADGRHRVRVDGEARTADDVVLAVPHDAVAGLLPSGTIAHQDQIASLGRSPIINVHLLYDRPVMREPFVAAIGSPAQFVFDRTASSGADAGHQLLSISLSAADDYLSWSRERLVRHFDAAIRDLFPGSASAVHLSGMVTREVAATFRGVPRTAALRPTTNSGVAGLHLAGAWTDTGWPATMEGAVRSGNAAVTAMLARRRAGHTNRTGVAA